MFWQSEILKRRSKKLWKGVERRFENLIHSREFLPLSSNLAQCCTSTTLLCGQAGVGNTHTGAHVYTYIHSLRGFCRDQIYIIQWDSRDASCRQNMLNSKTKRSPSYLLRLREICCDWRVVVSLVEEDKSGTIPLFSPPILFPFLYVPDLLGIVIICDTFLFSPAFLPHTGFLHPVYVFLILCCACWPVVICASTLSLLLFPCACIFTASTIIFCHLLRTSEIPQKERLEDLCHRVATGWFQSCVIRDLILSSKIRALHHSINIWEI